MSACVCAGESPCGPDTPGQMGPGWPQQTSHIPAQGLLQVVNTKCLPSGWAFPGTHQSTQHVSMVLSVPRKEMTEKDKKRPHLVI